MREEGVVVDGRLNAHRVERLNVVDLSISPRDTATNTNNTTMAIGEKVADIIAADLGFSKGPSSELS